MQAKTAASDSAWPGVGNNKVRTKLIPEWSVETPSSLPPKQYFEMKSVNNAWAGDKFERWLPPIHRRTAVGSSCVLPTLVQPESLVGSETGHYIVVCLLVSMAIREQKKQDSKGRGG